METIIMDELQKYYEYLRKAGADVPPTFESFKSTLSEEASAKQYYDYLRANKFDAPETYDSFANTFGLKKKVGGAGSPSPYGVDTRNALTPTQTVPEVSQNPYADKQVFDVISKARPNQVKEIYDRRVQAIDSQDPAKIKEANTELLSLNEESNPVTITPSDRQEIARLTGVTDPAKQLQVLRARIGQTTETGDLTFNVLDPTIDVNISALPKEDSEKLGAYANKLDYFLNGAKKDDRWSKKNVLTVGGKQTTDLEGFLNLIQGGASMNPAPAAVAEASRYGEETLNDSFSTGLESIRSTDKARYDRLTKALTNNEAIPTTDIVDLTAKGSKIISDITSQEMVDRNIDSDEYAARMNQINQDRTNNVYQHPDFLRSVISDVISKNYEKDGGVVFSKWMVTDKEIDEVPKEKFIEAGLDPNNPEFKKQLQVLKDKEGWMPFQNAIAKDDLFREFRKGAMSVPEGFASTVEAIANPEQKLVQDQQTAPFSVSGVANERGKYFKDNYGTWADAFNGFGQFSAQLAAMVAGGGAIGAAGESLGGGTAAARLLGATRLQKLGNTLVDNASLYSQYAVPFVMSYGDYYKDALSKGADPLQAKMMAFTNASMEGVSETLFDNVAFGKQVAKDLFNKENFSKISKIFSRGVLDETAQKEYKNVLLETLGTVAKSAGAAVKESFEEVPVALTNFIVDGVANPDLVKNKDVVEQMKDAFMGGLVSFSIPSLLGLGGSLRQQFAQNKPAQESLMIAAMQQPHVLESINKMVEKGELPQVEANRRIKVLNTAAQELKSIPETYEDGEAMSPQDREKYLSLSVKERVLEEMSSSGDRAVKAIAERQMADVVAQKESILTKQPIVEERKDTLTVTVEDNTQQQKETTDETQATVQGVPATTEETATTTTPEETRVASVEQQGASLFERVKGKVSNQLDAQGRPTGVYQLIGEQETAEGMRALKEQALDAPASLADQLGGDEQLVNDILDQATKEELESASNKLANRVRTDKTLSVEEADRHSELLESAMERKQSPLTEEERLAAEEFSKEEVYPSQNPAAATKQAAAAAAGISVSMPSQQGRTTTRTTGGVTVISPTTVTAPTPAVVIQPEGTAQTPETRAGVTVIRPTNEVQLFADRIISGENLDRDTDQQFYVNNAEAIEAELKKRFVESAGQEVPSEFTPEERVKVSDALFAFADNILKSGASEKVENSKNDYSDNSQVVSASEGVYSLGDFLSKIDFGNDDAAKTINALKDNRHLKNTKLVVTDNLPPESLGQSLPFSNVIRIKTSFKASTLAHEMMHLITAQVFDIGVSQRTDKEADFVRDILDVIEAFDSRQKFYKSYFEPRGYSYQDYPKELIAEVFSGSLLGNLINENKVIPDEVTRRVGKTLVRKIIDKIVEFFNGILGKSNKISVGEFIKRSFTQYGGMTPERLAEIIEQTGQRDTVENLTNLFKIPRDVLGRAVRAVAVAVKSGDNISEALKKGMSVFAAEKDLPQVDEKDFEGLVKSIMAGEKPKAGSAFAKHINVDVEGVVPSDQAYLDAINNPEPRDPIASYNMTRDTDIPQAFGSDLKQQELFDSKPSDEKFRTQMDMLQDGKSLIAAAQGMFGSTDVAVYGPELFRYIQNMPSQDTGLTNKKAVLLATLLGEIKQAMYTNTNPAAADAIRQLDGRVASYYNRFMHVTAKNLAAGRLLRLFRDKYMADIFTDTILEEDQVDEKNNTTEAEASDVSDEDAVQHEDKPKQKADEKKAKAARSEKKKKEASRKKGSKDEYGRKAKEKEDDIKDKYGSKDNLVTSIIDRIKKINCK